MRVNEEDEAGLNLEIYVSSKSAKGLELGDLEGFFKSMTKSRKGEMKKRKKVSVQIHEVLGE